MPRAAAALPPCAARGATSSSLGRVLRLAADQPRTARSSGTCSTRPPALGAARSRPSWSTIRRPSSGRAWRADSARSEGRGVWDRARWESLFAAPDPWGYSSAYEQTKYEHTLELLPEGPIGRALELACAEGHFTVQLAPRVGTLVAADIAAKALERAADALRRAGQRLVPPARHAARRAAGRLRSDRLQRGALLHRRRRRSSALRPQALRRPRARRPPAGHPRQRGRRRPGGDRLRLAGGLRQPSTSARRSPACPASSSSASCARRSTACSCSGAARRADARRRSAREVSERADGRHGRPAATINWGGCAVTRLEAANAWVNSRPADPDVPPDRDGRAGGTGALSCGTRPLRAAAGLSAAPRLPQHHARAVAVGAARARRADRRPRRAVDVRRRLSRLPHRRVAASCAATASAPACSCRPTMSAAEPSGIVTSASPPADGLGRAAPCWPGRGSRSARTPARIPI